MGPSGTVLGHMGTHYNTNIRNSLCFLQGEFFNKPHKNLSRI